MKNLKDRLFLGFVKLVLAWTIVALSFDVFMLVTSFYYPELNRSVGNWLTWHLDGRFN